MSLEWRLFNCAECPLLEILLENDKRYVVFHHVFLTDSQVAAHLSLTVSIREKVLCSDIDRVVKC